jgi:hypothetical protein
MTDRLEEQIDMAEQQISKSTGAIGVVQQKIFGLQVDRNIMFSNHNQVYKKRIEKRQRKLIIKIPFLKPFISNTEKVLCVTMGHSPLTLLEKMGIGWLFFYLKRSFFVFTDQRILHIPTNPGYRYRQSISEIRYVGCRSIRMKGRALVVEYKKNGRIEKFSSLSIKEKKKISALLKNISFGTFGGATKQRTHLCPQCATHLQDKENTCRGCGLKFKTFPIAAVCAAFIPGGGYFYTRQLFLGVLEAIWECLLIGTGIFMYNEYVNGVPSALWWLIAAAVLLLAGKSIAVIHAGIFIRDSIPRSKDIAFKQVPSLAN